MNSVTNLCSNGITDNHNVVIDMKAQGGVMITSTATAALMVILPMNDVTFNANTHNKNGNLISTKTNVCLSRGKRNFSFHFFLISFPLPAYLWFAMCLS